MSSVLKKIIFSLLSITIVLTTIVVIYFITPINTKQNLKLPSSDTSEIIKYLKTKKYNLNFLDKLFLKIATNPREGWIYINSKKMPRYKFLKQVGSYANHYTPVTIIPGETSYFILQMLKKKLNYNIDKLVISYKELAPYKEGNFLANTYNIPIYFKERDTIKFLIDNSFKEYKKISISYFNKFDKKEWKKIITVASIIEKEAANRTEMPKISSVIFNRLNKKMKLQMDGTLNYGQYSHTKVTPQRIKNDLSRYNTYKHKGLPTIPICNVSKEAIISAINPVDTNYLYFMKNSKGTHNFSSKYKEHIKNIKLRKEYIKYQ